MFSINQNGTFLKVVMYLKGLLEHLNVELNNSGFNTNDNYLGLGTVQVAISPDQFETYQESNKQFSVNLGNLHTVLKTLGNVKDVVQYNVNDDSMTISTDSETEKFNTTVPLGKYSVSRKGTSQNFNYEHSIELKSKNLYDILKKLVVFDDTIHITLHKNTILFHAGKTTLSLEHPDGETVDTQVTYSFPSKELLAFSKAYSFSDSVSVYLGKDMPLSLYYSFKNECGSLQLFLSNC